MSNDMSGSPVTLSERTGGSIGARGGALLGLVVLALLLLLDGSRLAGEWTFFQSRALVSSHGTAPVPQDDAATPRLDVALRAVAARLPRDAVCVIGVDAWQRTYFRASYLLMPRRVWPAVDRPSPVSAAQLGRALAAHHAGCLLALPGAAVPSGLHVVYDGAIDLYVVASGRPVP